MEQNWRNVFIDEDLSCGHVAFAWQNEIKRTELKRTERAH